MTNTINAYIVILYTFFLTDLLILSSTRLLDKIHGRVLEQ